MQPKFLHRTFPSALGPPGFFGAAALAAGYPEEAAAGSGRGLGAGSAGLAGGLPGFRKTSALSFSASVTKVPSPTDFP